MHLPFASNFASFAVKDARGAFATNDYQGAFQAVPPSPGSPESSVRRRATAIHDKDVSLFAVNGPHRPRRAATTTGLLSSRSLSPTLFTQTLSQHSTLDRGASSMGSSSIEPRSPSPQPMSWGTSAFCGSIGHTPDVMRISAARPAIVGGGTPVPCVVTRHPCDDPPGPGKYDAAPLLPATFANSQRFDRSVANDVRFDREARIVRPRGIPHVSSAARFVDTTPVTNHAKVADGTPGPGSYPLSEWSDFGPRSRTVHDPPRPQTTIGTGRTIVHRDREQQSVRGSTSSFGSTARTDIRMDYLDAHDGRRGREGRVLGMPDRGRNLTGASYHGFSRDDRVYLRHKSPPGKKRFTKEAGEFSMSEVRKYVGRTRPNGRPLYVGRPDLSQSFGGAW